MIKALLPSLLLCFISLDAYEISFEEGENQELSSYLEKGVFEYNSPFFNNATPEPFFICIKNDQDDLIGGLEGVFYAKITWIEHVFIEESHRKQGIGLKLLQKIEQVSKDKGCTMMELITYDFQAPLFYEKCGFVRAGHIPNFAGGHDLFLMRKFL